MIFLTGFLALATLVLLGAQIPTRGIVRANSGLNVRSGPGTEYSDIGTLINGTDVQILEVSGKWYKIQSGAMQGYSFGKYIEVTEYTTVNEDEAAKRPYSTLRETNPNRPEVRKIDPRIIPQSD